ncbi:cytochrome b-c1 complex subunit 7 [Bombus fervidus]|uniref:cytochrome b-c1 complex subunit 7 n=1 Tax=Bombus fervidus TaxID=203811 RepID=UPI003AB24511
MSKIFRIFKPSIGLIKRYQSQIQNNRNTWRMKIKKQAFYLSGYHKYGLYTHDIFYDQDPVIREALRRLPIQVLDSRNFRLIRASQLDFLKIHLPKEKWITFEQDMEYRYLNPYIEEIKAERDEIYQFGCTNYSDSDWPSCEIK